jgi:hypothetical protein
MTCRHRGTAPADSLSATRPGNEVVFETLKVRLPLDVLEESVPLRTSSIERFSAPRLTRRETHRSARCCTGGWTDS